MQIFSSLVAAFAVILAANAASIPSDITHMPNALNCSSALDTVSERLVTLKTSVTKDRGLGEVWDYDRLAESLNAVKGSCCSINQAVSDFDSELLLDSLNHTVYVTLDALSTIATKGPSYGDIAKFIVEDQLVKFGKNINGLSTCFQLLIPTANSTVRQNYFSRINAALNSTHAVYN